MTAAGGDGAGHPHTVLTAIGRVAMRDGRITGNSRVLTFVTSQRG